MTAKFESFAPLPKCMMNWIEFSLSAETSLEPELVKLIQIRASQINGCANFISAHAREARLLGMDDQRIDLLPAWRDAPCYSDRERALIGWTEALTRLSEEHPEESALADLQIHFSEEERVAIALIVLAVNGWNRLCVGFGLWHDYAAA